MTTHTRALIPLAALALSLTTAHADPSPLPWTSADAHVVCDLTVSALDRALEVEAWERPEDATILTVTTGGWYWLFDGSERPASVLAVSDTHWIRVSNPTNPEGVSAQQNCGADWLVSASEERYLGLFWLDAGRNAVTLHHACPLIRLGVCTDHDRGRPGMSCTSHRAHAVALGAESLCAVRTP